MKNSDRGLLYVVSLSLMLNVIGTHLRLSRIESVLDVAARALATRGAR